MALGKVFLKFSKVSKEVPRRCQGFPKRRSRRNTAHRDGERMISEPVEQFGLIGGNAADFLHPKSEFLPCPHLLHAPSPASSCRIAGSATADTLGWTGYASFPGCTIHARSRPRSSNAIWSDFVMVGPSAHLNSTPYRFPPRNCSRSNSAPPCVKVKGSVLDIDR